MKYILIIFTLLTLTSCSSRMTDLNDNGLEIDIYQNDMTYEKFKQKDRKSTRLNSSHSQQSRMPSSA